MYLFADTDPQMVRQIQQLLDNIRHHRVSLEQYITQMVELVGREAVVQSIELPHPVRIHHMYEISRGYPISMSMLIIQAACFCSGSSAFWMLRAVPV